MVWVCEKTPKKSNRNIILCIVNGWEEKTAFFSFVFFFACLLMNAFPPVIPFSSLKHKKKHEPKHKYILTKELPKILIYEPLTEPWLFGNRCVLWYVLGILFILFFLNGSYTRRVRSAEAELLCVCVGYFLEAVTTVPLSIVWSTSMSNPYSESWPPGIWFSL